MNEFDVIEKYFRPLTMGHDALDNDAAVVNIPAGHELIVTSDNSNAGTHFFANAHPQDIANKVLRRNLSDLAAMGAKPLCYQLNISFPEEPSEGWLKDFISALLADQKKFEIYCSGGDTSSINGPLSISITALGTVPSGKALNRSGAKPGDHIILTGPVGDAYIGYRVLDKKIKTADDDYFINAYYRPMPRPGVSEIIRDDASAAIDISDGLVADLGHICKASNCAANISIVSGIFSTQGEKSGVAAAQLLTGGDDYEVLLAVPSEKSAGLMNNLRQHGLNPVKIGEFAPGSGVTVRDAAGQAITLEKSGWRHF